MNEQEWKQKAFNGAYRGLQWQGFEKSRNERLGHCAFRGEDGMCCALGWLIPGKPPEAISVAEVASKYLAPGLRLKVPVSLRRLAFLRSLMHAHDSSRGPEDMKSRLERLALESDLEIPTPWGEL